MKTSVTRRSGSALLVVLGIVTIISVVCGMLGVTATAQTRSSQITRDMLKARMIAESGLNKAYNAVKGDFALAANYQLTESFSGGTYTVRAVPLSGVAADRAQLFAEGTCGLGHVVVAADLENIPKLTGGSGAGDNYMMPFDVLVGGVMSVRGNFHAAVTLFHANGNVDLGGSATVEGGIISSSGTATWASKPATVTLRSNQPKQVIYPAALEAAINGLISYAQSKGAVYASGASIPAVPPGGVAYCTGSDSGWSGHGTGCFIFAGAFNTKQVTLSAGSANYPALVVLSPNSVQFNAGTVITGTLLLPTSSLKLNGGAAIYGPLLIGQSFTGNGTADLWAGQGQQFLVPVPATMTDNVVITAWH